MAKKHAPQAKCLQYNMVRVERSTFLKLRQLKKRRRCRSMNALILKLMERKFTKSSSR